jgi:hypothetical protein
MKINKKLIIAKLTLKKVIAIYNEHGKLPSAISKDKNEAKLGRWILTQRKNKKGKGIWHPDLETIANEHGLPTLFENIDLKQIAIDKLMLVIAFYDEYGKLPSSVATHKNEKKLGKWITTQRINKKGTIKGTVWYPKLEEIATKHGIPNVFKDSKQMAIDKLMLVIEFYNKHKKLPGQTAKNDDEKKLGKWICSQRSNKNGTVNRTWYPKLEEIAIKHNLPNLFETRK